MLVCAQHGERFLPSTAQERTKCAVKKKGKGKGSAKRVGKGRLSFARRWSGRDDSMTEIDSAKG